MASLFCKDFVLVLRLQKTYVKIEGLLSIKRLQRKEDSLINSTKICFVFASSLLIIFNKILQKVDLEISICRV